MREYDERARPDQADGGKILAGVVADVLVERRIARKRTGAADDKRIAIRGAARDLARCGRAAGSWTIFDHDLLAERLAHFLRRDAGEEIVAAAGRIGHDKCNRAVGVVLL